MDRNAIRKLVDWMRGVRPLNNAALVRERDSLFAVARCPLNNSEPLHRRALSTLFRALVPRAADESDEVPRTGLHWDLIGFQGTDPASDLRGAGIFVLVTVHLPTVRVPTLREK